LYLEHLDGEGRRFFELACEQDLEGIICKPSLFWNEEGATYMMS
jgi:ATP-dependent DNA ligase